MAILHKNITAAADIHNPKWFSGANSGDYAFKNEKGELESIDELLLPAALNFVDGSVAPPTTNSGDIYILSSGGSVNAGWGGVSLQDWVRYDGAAWNSITPQKSSLCYDKTADLLKVYDGSAWAGMGASFGKFGISDSTGAFTYYSGIDTALAAASSGDVIEQFANVTSTSTSSIALVDGVTWNMNGYSYINTAGSNFNFITIANGVKFTINNGYIKRDGGTYSHTANALIQGSNLTTGEITSNGVVYEHLTSTVVKNATSLTGGIFKSSTTGTYAFLGYGIYKGVKIITSKINGFSGSSCKIYNSYIYSSSSYNYFLNGGVKAYNSIFESDGERACYLGNNSNEAHNCSFISSASHAVQVLGDTSTDFSKLYNCTAHSSGSSGIYLTGYAEAYNCSSYSTADRGMRIFDYSRAYNCFTYTNASQGIYATEDAIIKNCTIKTDWNNATGHGVYVLLANVGNGFEIIGCNIEVFNASANALNISSVSNGRWAKNAFRGCTTAVVNTNANLITNTPDSLGNLLL